MFDNSTVGEYDSYQVTLFDNPTVGEYDKNQVPKDRNGDRINTCQQSGSVNLHGGSVNLHSGSVNLHSGSVNFECEDCKNGSCDKPFSESIISIEDSQSICPSDIFQCDGANSINSTTHDHNNSTFSDSEDEVDSAPVPVVLVPAAVQPGPGQPLVLEVDTTGNLSLPASIPLCMVTNFRSIYNKVENFKTFLREVAPDCTVACETWDYEGRRKSLEDMLEGTSYSVLAYRRGKGHYLQPG